MIRRYLSLFLLWAPFVAMGVPATMGSIGDSISVGSFAHPELFWDLLEIEKVYKKKVLYPDPKAYANDFSKIIEVDDGKVVPPSRIFSGNDPDVPGWLQSTWADIKKNNAGALVDIEEYSWPFLLGRLSGVPTKEITLVGEMGRRAGDTKTQVDNLLGKAKNLPEVVLISWTGNDLCSHKLEEKAEKTKTDHSNRILDGLTKLMAGNEPKDKTVKVLVVSHLNVAQLVDSDAILDKQVLAFGERRKCRDFRKHVSDKDVVKDLTEAGLKGLIATISIAKKQTYKDMPPINEVCKTILTTHKGDEGYAARLDKLKAYTTAYREGAKDAVDRANALRAKDFAAKRIEFHFLKASEEFEADPEDIGNDCFHLSLGGAQKVARLLDREIKARKLLP